jgi:multisubunit Na+/H+ antiporter MnhB subunit
MNRITTDRITIDHITISRARRRKIAFDVVVALFLLGSLVYVATYMRGIDLVFSEVVLDFRSMAERMNIENMVAVVYLGPRIFDTFLEVNVVVLTVFGMKFIRSTS